MGLGGIPVSGGITGKGTLIFTNLLYDPLLRDLYDNPLPVPVYALGGDAGVAGFEAAFAVDRDPQTLWKTPVSSEDLSITMIHGANPPMVYGIVLLGHNITAAAVSLAKFEGGMDTNYNTVSEDLVINAAALTPAYHLLATPAAHDHWRIRVNFIAPTALQIGEIFLIGSPPLAFARNYNWLAPTYPEFGQVVDESEGGIRRIYPRWKRFRKDMTSNAVAETQLLAFHAAAENAHVILSPDGANGKAYFGDIALEPQAEDKGKWDVIAKFIEVAK